MVTRDRAENRDGPKVRSGKGGSKESLFLPEDLKVLTLWVRGEDGDAGLKGQRCSCDPKNL